MKALWLALVLGSFLLVGCVPDFVSVSRDGTIALTLTKEGDFDPIEGDDQRLYLTNANGEFLTRIEGMDDCAWPQISPSGKFIVADSEEGLVLYDRKSRKRRVIYRPPKGAGDSGSRLPAWSPDDKKIALFEGDYDSPNFALKVYDVKRRELEVLDRLASPLATWLPDSKRLAYVSLPRDVSEDDESFPFGDLRIMNVRTGKQTTLARGQLSPFTKIAAFPQGESILFCCVDWEDLEFRRMGITAPIVLRKQPLPRRVKKEPTPTRGETEEVETSPLEEGEAKPAAERAQPAASEEKAEEKGFVLTEGQPFCYMTCAVSPDGKRIAYVRYVWDQPSAGRLDVEKEQTEEEKTRKRESEEENPETDEEDNEPKGVEFCVAKADGTDSVVVLRSMGQGQMPQVLWVSNTRLLCGTVSFDSGEDSKSRLILVDADGKNKFDLIETITTKFADQFEREGEKEDRGEEEGI